MEDDPDQPPSFNWQQWVENNRWLILIALIGLILLGLGFRYLKSPNQPERVEIIPLAEGSSNSPEIVIDVAGSVNRPGIYKLPSGARVGDALDAAGGLSSSADQSWVERTINRAEKLRDGQKIYILSTEELDSGRAEELSGLQQGIVSGTNTTSTISINSANQSQLEALWGIGPVTAEAIITGRPYSSVEELLTRKIIKQNIFYILRIFCLKKAYHKSSQSSYPENMGMVVHKTRHNHPAFSVYHSCFRPDIVNHSAVVTYITDSFIFNCKSLSMRIFFVTGKYVCIQNNQVGGIFPVPCK